MSRLKWGFSKNDGEWTLMVPLYVWRGRFYDPCMDQERRGWVAYILRIGVRRERGFYKVGGICCRLLIGKAPVGKSVLVRDYAEV